jgi:hypothetical protein
MDAEMEEMESSVKRSRLTLQQLAAAPWWSCRLRYRKQHFGCCNAEEDALWENYSVCAEHGHHIRRAYWRWVELQQVRSSRS